MEEVKCQSPNESDNVEDDVNEDELDSEGNEDSEYSEESDDDEPVHKYERIGNNLANLLSKDAASCMAVTDKFIAIGTHWGMVHVIDHLGNNIKEFSVHTTTVNQISVDSRGEYIGSCSDDGRVCLTGLYDAENNQTMNLDCPVKAIALDPRFARPHSGNAFVTGTGDKLVWYEKSSWLGRSKSSVLHSGEGPIRLIKWRSCFLSWANDLGVNVYDCQFKQRFSYIAKDDPSLRPELHRCNIYWKDDTTFLIGWADVLKICVVRDRSTSSRDPDLPSRCVEIIAVLRTEWSICGLASKDDLVVALAYLSEGPRLADEMDGARRPQLHVIKPLINDYDDVNSDALTVNSFHLYRSNEYHLDCLLEESVYFILSPQDLIIARPRDHDDHIQWLVERGRFIEALKSASESPSDLRNYSVASIGEAYMKHLIEEGEFEEAARQSQTVLGRSKQLWEEQVYKFAKLKQLRVISSYLPTREPRLNQTVYELILNEFLQSNVDRFAEIVNDWPSDIYDIHTVINAVLDRLVSRPGDPVLLESLARLHSYDRRYDRALSIYLDLSHPNTFQLIDKHNLAHCINDKVVALIELDASKAIPLLLDNLQHVPIETVVDQLEDFPRYLHTYLDSLYKKDRAISKGFHSRQVQLYADYEPHKLMDFLKDSDYYPLPKAVKVCRDRGFTAEVVYLLGRMGNWKEALRLIIEDLKDVRKAIEFAKDIQDNELWRDLIEYSMDKPEFIRGLLQHSGTHINPLQVVQQIPRDLHVPDLQVSLVKILHDYNLQVSLREGCSRILVSDCFSLFDRLYRGVKRGQSVSSHCPVCRNPVLSCSTDAALFQCLHTYHGECTPVGPHGIFCNVCSTKQQKDRSRTLSR